MRRLHRLNKLGTKDVIWPEFLQLAIQITHQKAGFNFIKRSNDAVVAKPY